MNCKVDEMGDKVMLVKTEWVLHHWIPGDRDQACAQCFPDGKYTIDDFVCYKHQAEALEAE